MAIGFYHSNGTIRLYAREHRKAVRRSNGARTITRNVASRAIPAHNAHKPSSILSRVVRAIRKAVGGGR